MVINYSEKNIYKVLATESRRADLTSGKLAKIHEKLGELLSYEILDFLELQDVEIQHVQGIKKSLSISTNEKFIIAVLMRGGLYVAEGLKNIFDGKYNMEFIFNNEIASILKYNNTKEYNLIIVDSVINTGKSIDTILDQINIEAYKNIFITTLVLQKGAYEKYHNNNHIKLLTVRISENFYIGKGKTDTGNRLFNIEK